jgi:GntR family transcriptional regulator/MocR family aminotransferase
VLLRLPPGLRDDVALAQAARAQDMSPSPLSPWYARPGFAHAGLVLGVTNLHEDRARATCERLMRLIAQHA